MAREWHVHSDISRTLVIIHDVDVESKRDVCVREKKRANPGASGEYTMTLHHFGRTMLAVHKVPWCGRVPLWVSLFSSLFFLLVPVVLACTSDMAFDLGVWFLVGLRSRAGAGET